jgi:hypothetical protein
VNFLLPIHIADHAYAAGVGRAIASARRAALPRTGTLLLRVAAIAGRARIGAAATKTRNQSGDGHDDHEFIVSLRLL